MKRTVFELKIWQKPNQSCFFLLLWGDRKQQLTASLSDAGEVQRWYQRWQQRYTRFYLPSTRAISSSGRLDPGSGDPGNDLREAETEFLQSFQRWLGEGEGRKIQQRIRDELMRLAQQPSTTAPSTGIDLFLACDSPEMARLPWEIWELAPDEAPVGTVRIIRTAMDRDEGTHPGRSPRPRKARILAILGEDPNLPLQEHWKALRSLRAIADVDRVTWLPDEDPVAIKTRIARAICDERGWDILFFAGHSDETAVTGGRFAIAPHISFSISELEEQLTQAKEQGLQLAIFNSCSGLSIAHSLMDLGVQVVAMREPIRVDVAKSFLNRLCQELLKHKDILDAVLAARSYLQTTEKFAAPSAYLLPSFFSPPNTAPYQIKPFGWKRQMQQWVPTKLETASFGLLMALSFVAPFQETLLDLRIAAEAIYRHHTNQLPPNKPAPVLFVAIDQESINRASAQMEGFRTKPMDRRYLAALVRQSASAGAKVIGIDYMLDSQESNEKKLASAIQSAVKTQQTWFVFAAREPDKLWVRDQIANPDWSLQGDIYFYPWQLEIPEDPFCTKFCPFSYLLALGHQLKQPTGSSTTVPQPRLTNQVNFQQTVSTALKQQRQNGPQGITAFLSRSQPSVSSDVVIDFSVPPNLAYQHVSAWEFLSNPRLQAHLASQVVIIGAGGYADVPEDNFVMPMAVNYWCHIHLTKAQKSCPEWITGGELHAYMVHHWLSSHQVIRIPDWWMISLAALLAKGMTLILLSRSTVQRQKLIWILVAATVLTILLQLQIYITALVLIPWFLPSVTAWAYVLFAIKRKA